MPTDLQLLKAYGHLPQVPLSDMNDGSARSVITEDIEQHILRRFCDHPDAADEEIADAAPDKLAEQLDVDLDRAAGFIRAHKRMRRFAEYNNARWPKGCHDSHREIHAVQVYVDWSTFPSHNMRTVTSDELDQIVEAGVWGMTREEVRDRFSGWPMAKVALWLSDEAYRRVGVLHVHLDQGVGDQIHVISKSIPGSTIGLGWFPDGSCSDHVFQHLDTIQFSLMGLARLMCHEFGHNHGEPHQFSGQSTHHSVMSYDPPRLFYGFSTGEAPHRLPRDRSIDSLIEKYGGVYVEDPTDPTPPPQPPPEPPSGRPEITYTERGVQIAGYDYLLTPRPEV